jgi:hypothetical protein
MPKPRSNGLEQLPLGQIVELVRVASMRSKGISVGQHPTSAEQEPKSRMKMPVEISPLTGRGLKSLEVPQNSSSSGIHCYIGKSESSSAASVSNDGLEYSY